MRLDLGSSSLDPLDVADTPDGVLRRIGVFFFSVSYPHLACDLPIPDPEYNLCVCLG